MRDELERVNRTNMGRYMCHSKKLVLLDFREDFKVEKTFYIFSFFFQFFFLILFLFVFKLETVKEC